jgi:OOP family OmpA-OmpF porin
MLAHVVFAFDRHAEADIRSHSLAQLQGLVDRIRSQGLEVRGIRLTGHADRLNGTGKADYNQRLSEQRVQTVRALLLRLGLDERLMRAEARGDTQPVEACASPVRSQAELQECLLPNRRVEIEIDARARPQ